MAVTAWPAATNPSYLYLDFDNPPASDRSKDQQVEIGESVITLPPAAEWFDQNKSDIDPKSYDHATWDSLDFGTSRTWRDEASMSSERQIG